MKITAMEEYGLRCVLTIARHAGSGPVPAQRIATHEGLSMPYTQKVLRGLSRAGLIVAQRGSAGGYTLASPLATMTVGQVMRAMGSTIVIEDLCERHTGEQDVCCHQGSCTIRPVWKHISEFLMVTLDAIPLQLLLQDEQQVSRHLASFLGESPDLMSMAQPSA